MATVLDVIRRSLRLIGAIAAGDEPSAIDAQTGLEAFQAMLGSWETRSVRLGAAVDTTFGLATVITLPVTHNDALAFNLAVALAPEYGRADALPAIVPQADRAFRALQAQYTKAPQIGADPAVVMQRGILGNAGWVAGS